MKLHDCKYEITLDFETYYDKNYSLTKMTMAEYIRDDRFFIHGVAVKLDDGPILKFDWRDPQALQQGLEELPWDDALLIAQNTHFDGLILSEHFGIVPKMYADTRSMARAYFPHTESASLKNIATVLDLGIKDQTSLFNVLGVREPSDEATDALMQYCHDDVELTYKAWKLLHSVFSREELELIHLTVRMFAQPVLQIDPQVLQELIDGYDQRTRSLLNSLADQKFAITETEVRSREKFASALRERKVEPPTKLSPSTGNPTYAFAKSDEEFQALSKNADPVVRDLVSLRLHLASRLIQTRSKRFLDVTENGTKPLPIPLNYCGAHTMRWSGGDKMNLQNLSRDGGIRDALIAPEGHLIVAADLSQIEARVLAWLAQEERLMAQFADPNIDPYREMASEIYGKHPDDIDNIERFVGKTAVLGLGYGMGAKKFAMWLSSNPEIPEDQQDISFTSRVVQTYRALNRRIVDLWYSLDKKIPELMHEGSGVHVRNTVQFGRACLRFPNGMAIRYPKLHQEEYGDYTYLTKKGRRSLYGGLLTENIVQCLARLVIGDHLRAIDEISKVVLTVHDEIVSVIPEEQATSIEDRILDIMRTPPSWAPDLVLDAEVKIAKHYAK